MENQLRWNGFGEKPSLVISKLAYAFFRYGDKKSSLFVNTSLAIFLATGVCVLTLTFVTPDNISLAILSGVLGAASVSRVAILFFHSPTYKADLDKIITTQTLELLHSNGYMRTKFDLYRSLAGQVCSGLEENVIWAESFQDGNTGIVTFRDTTTKKHTTYKFDLSNKTVTQVQ